MSFDVSGKHVVVVGAGASGAAAATLLVSRGADVVLSERRSDAAPRNLPAAVRVELGPHRPELLTAADLIVLSPGVPSDLSVFDAARAAGVPVIGEVELAFRWLRGRTIAITGTKGKSTTTTLTARMLAQAGLPVTAGGNLGTPLSTQVDETRPDALHVVEVSSFQLETTDQFHPWVSVLLNLSPDHLDRHPTFEAYAAAKARIFRNQTSADWAVINADDPAALALARGGRAARFDFALDASIEHGVTVEAGHIVERKAGTVSPLVPLDAVRLPGRHLLADVLAATAVSCLAGVPPAAMRRAVEEFHGLEHALETVATVGGVRFVNDSKATNVVSARRALESFDGGVVAIMGGRYKGGRFEDLAEPLRARARAVVAIGEATSRIEQALGSVVPVAHADSMDAAVRRAADLAQPDGVVLLAPACSSFDMFEDYRARGRAFKHAVAALAGTAGKELER